MGNKGNKEGIKIPSWLRYSIYVATIILFATGAIWLAANYLFDPAISVGLQIVLLTKFWMMKIHGLAVMVALFLYGSLLRSHIIKGWKSKRNRNSGLILLLVLGSLTLSGYLLYYSGNENMREISSIFHWLVGLVLAFALPLHIYYGRRKKEKVRK